MKALSKGNNWYRFLAYLLLIVQLGSYGLSAVLISYSDLELQIEHSNFEDMEVEEEKEQKDKIEVLRVLTDFEIPLFSEDFRSNENYRIAFIVDVSTPPPEYMV